MNSNEVISIVGAVVGVLGLVFGVAQYVRSKKVQERLQEQLRVFIDRANYVSMDHRAIEHFAVTHDDQELTRWLWLNHQAGCDLYMSMVDAFLSRESRFTFTDLKRIAQTPLVGGQWQERYWISVLALRRENRDIPVPTVDSYEIPARVQRLLSSAELVSAKQETADPSTEVRDGQSRTRRSLRRLFW